MSQSLGETRISSWIRLKGALVRRETKVLVKWQARYDPRNNKEKLKTHKTTVQIICKNINVTHLRLKCTFFLMALVTYFYYWHFSLLFFQYSPASWFLDTLLGEEWGKPSIKTSSIFNQKSVKGLKSSFSKGSVSPVKIITPISWQWHWLKKKKEYALNIWCPIHLFIQQGFEDRTVKRQPQSPQGESRVPDTGQHWGGFLKRVNRVLARATPQRTGLNNKSRLRLGGRRHQMHYKRASKTLFVGE